MSDTRECPCCAELIKKRAKVCRYCNNSVTPIYVDNQEANVQIEKIIELHSKGTKTRDISNILKEDGFTRIDTNELWTVDQIEETVRNFSASKTEVNNARKIIPKGAISCPKCSSIALGGRGFLIWFFVIILFPIGLLLLLLKPTYKCTKCSFTFKS